MVLPNWLSALWRQRSYTLSESGAVPTGESISLFVSNLEERIVLNASPLLSPDVLLHNSDTVESSVEGIENPIATISSNTTQDAMELPGESGNPDLFSLIRGGDSLKKQVGDRVDQNSANVIYSGHIDVEPGESFVERFADDEIVSARLTDSIDFDLSPAQPSHSIVFVDSRVADYESLIADIETDYDVVLIDADIDGLKQIQAALDGVADLGAIHIVSHGSAGRVYLGDTVLSHENLNEFAHELGEIGDTLTAEGDILFYGCDVGMGEQGEAFLDRLSELTGADVAASIDETGSYELSGDWELEATTGEVETAIVFSATAQTEYGYLLAGTPTVTSIAVDDGASTSDGITTDNRLVFSGTALADALVTITLDEPGDIAGPMIIGTPTADSTGNWTLDYTGTTLAEGNYGITASTTDTGGTTTTSARFDFTIDKTPTINLTGTSGEVEIKMNGNDLIVTQGGGEIYRAAVANLTSLTINGRDGETDTITLISNTALPDNVTINGGTGAGNDKLVIQNDGGAATINLTGNESGSVVVDGTTVSFSEIEPNTVAFAGATNDLIVNISSTVTGNVQIANGAVGFATISSAATTPDFATVNVNPSSSLTVNLVNSSNDTVIINNLSNDFGAALSVNTGGGNDQIVMTGITTYESALTLSGQSGNDTLTINPALALKNMAALQLTAETIDVKDSIRFGSLVIDGGTTTFDNTVDGGNVTINGTGTTTFKGNVGSGTASGIGFGTGAAITINSSGSTVFQNQVKSASGIVQADGAGTVTFSQDVDLLQGDTASTFNGNVVLDGLILTAGHDVTIGNAATDTLTISTTDVTINTSANNSTVGIDAVTILSSNLGINAGSNTASSIDGAITGAGNLTFSGTGTLTLSNSANANAITGYSGVITVDNGTIRVTASGALGTTAGGTTVTDDGTLTLDGVSYAATEGVTLNGGTIAATDTSSFAGTIRLEANSKVDVASGKTLTLSGVIDDGSNSFGWEKTGDGTLTLSGINTYNGTTTLSAGVTNVTGEIGSGSAAGTVSLVGGSLAGTGIVNAPVSGNSTSSISATGSSTNLRLGDGSAAGYSHAGNLSIDSDQTVTISDSNTAELGSITNLGSGGILSAANGVTIGSGETLKGSGTVQTSSGTLNILSGGDLSPGNSPGSINTNNLSLASGANLNIDFNIPDAATTEFDQVKVTGIVSLDGANLVTNVASSAGISGGESFIIIDNDDFDPVNGKLKFGGTTLEEGGEIAGLFGSTHKARITYAGGDGNDVAIIVDGSISLTANGNVTIRRVGGNIQTSVGGTVVDSRPIASVNGNVVTINGGAGNDTLTIDLDDYTDTGSSGINFNGTIHFDGMDGKDDIVIEDSDGAGDTIDTINYTFTDKDSGSIVIDQDGPAFGSIDSFTITYDNLEPITQSIAADHVTLTYAATNDVITVDADGVNTKVTATENGNPSAETVSFINPTKSLTINSGAGNDTITLSSFGTSTGGFNAALTVNGDSGADTINVNTDLTLGSVVAGNTGNVLLTTEDINVGANKRIDTTAATVNGQTGNVTFTATDEFDMMAGSRINVTNGVINLSATNNIDIAEIDTSNGNVTIASSAGNVEILGGEGGIVSSGQAEIDIDAVTGITINDTLDSGGEKITLTSTGDDSDITINANITAAGGDVDIDAGRSVTSDTNGVITTTDDLAVLSDSGTVNIAAAGTGSVNLVGNIITTGANNGAGTGKNAGQVDITTTDGSITVANITASGGNGAGGNDGGNAAAINITSGDSGNDATHSITLNSAITASAGTGMSAGTAGIITLKADGAIVDGSDVATDIVAGQMQLIAGTGIAGGTAPNDILEIDVTILAATTDTGGIAINDVVNGLTIGSVTANGCTTSGVTITGSGTDINSVISITSTDSLTVNNGVSHARGGNIMLTNTGDNSDITINADITAAGGNIQIDSDEDILQTDGAVTTTSNGTITYTAGKVDNNTDGTPGGGITTSTGKDTKITAETGAISLTADGNISVTEIDTTSGAVDITSHDGSVTVLTGDDANDGIVTTFANGTIIISAEQGVTVNDGITTNGSKVTIDADREGGNTGGLTTSAEGDITSGSADISVTAAALTLAGDVNAGVANVFLHNSSTQTIGLADGGVGSFNLNETEANLITAKILEVGNASAGTVTIGNLNLANGKVPTLLIRTGDAVQEPAGASDNSADLSVTSLAIQSEDGIDIDIDTTNLAATNTKTNGVSITDTNSGMTIGSVVTATQGTISGVANTASGQTVKLEAQGGILAINQAISTEGGLVDLDTNSAITSNAAGTLTTTATANSGTNSGNVDIDATGAATIDLLGTIDTTGAANNSGSGSDGGNVNIDTAGGTISIEKVTTNGGVATAGDNNGGSAGDITLNTGGQTITLHDTLSAIGGAKSNAGTQGTGGNVKVGDPIILDDNITITTGSTAGNVTFESSVNADASNADGVETLTVTAGAGSIDFDGIVGGVRPLGGVTINSASNVTIDTTFNTISFAQTTGTGTTKVDGVINTTGNGTNFDLTTATIDINANVNTNGGNVDLNADTLIHLEAGDTISTTSPVAGAASGTIDIDVTGNGTIKLDGALTTTGANNAAGAGGAAGQVDIDTANGSVLVQNITASGGNGTAAAGAAAVINVISSGGDNDGITLTGQLISQGGAGTPAAGDGTIRLKSADNIVDSNGTGNDIIARLLIVDAMTGVATIANPLETTIEDIDLDNSTSGEVGIAESDNITINQIDQAGAGDVTLSTTSGLITVAAGQPGVSATSGTVTLDANGTNSDVVINDDVTTSAGGGVTINADDSITFAATGKVAATGAGNVVLTSNTDNTNGDSDDSIFMANGAIVDGGSGTVTLTIAGNDSGNITLGGIITTSITATSVNISTTEGGLIDGGDTHTDVASAGTVVIDVKTGVGNAGAIDTAVARLNIDNATSGDININETDAVTIAKAVQAMTGNIDIDAGGSITVDNNGGGNAVTVLGANTIHLDANGNSSGITVRDGIQTVNGALTLTADDDINFDADGDLTTTTGKITVTADADGSGGGSGGAIAMTDGTEINSGNAEIILMADENIAIGRIITTNDSRTALAITSQSGGITDAGDTGTSDIQVTGANSGIELRAATGIGDSNAIETEINHLAAANSTSGNINIANSNGGNLLEIDTVNTLSGVVNTGPGGGISITNNSPLTVTSTAKVQTHSGNIVLAAQNTGDLSLQGQVNVTNGAGNITFNAGNNVQLFDTGNAFDVDAPSGSVSMTANSEVRFLSAAGVEFNPQSATASSTHVRSHSGVVSNWGVRVDNVNIPQVGSDGLLTVSGEVGRVGERNVLLRIDWADGDVTLVPIANGPGTFSETHFYVTNPNPENPAADIPVRFDIIAAANLAGGSTNIRALGTVDSIPINVTVNEVASVVTATPNNGGNFLLLDLGDAPVPGEGLAAVAIDTTPQVPQLAFPESTTIGEEGGTSSFVSSNNQLFDISTVSIEASIEETIVLLQILTPDGRQIGKLIELPSGVLNDLPELFSTLPDGNYEILIREAGETRLKRVIKVQLEDGVSTEESTTTSPQDLKQEGGNTPTNGTPETRGTPETNIIPTSPSDQPNDDSPKSTDMSMSHRLNNAGRIIDSTANQTPARADGANLTRHFAIDASTMSQRSGDPQVPGEATQDEDSDVTFVSFGDTGIVTAFMLGSLQKTHRHNQRTKKEVDACMERLEQGAATRASRLIQRLRRKQKHVP